MTYQHDSSRFAPLDLPQRWTKHQFAELFQALAIPPAFIEERLQLASHSFGTMEDVHGCSAWFHFLCKNVEVEDVVVEARAPVYPVGHSRRTIRADLVRAIRPQILSMGLADQRELDDLEAAVRTHLDNPDTIVMPHLIFLAWGRKPAAA